MTSDSESSSRRWRDLAMWSTLAAPLALGFLVGRRSRWGGLAAGVGAAALIGATRWQLGRVFHDQPPYEIERRLGAIEIRRYPALALARTRIDTPDFERALRRGFERLHAYLFGENAEHERLPLITPVTTEGERLATTAPLAGTADGAFTMSFVMPPGRLLSSLPRPKDARIELHEHGSRRIAALAFHGGFTRESIARHARELLARLGEAGLTPQGQVAFAAYDGPTTLPLLRRNEVWVEIAEPH